MFLQLPPAGWLPDQNVIWKLECKITSILTQNRKVAVLIGNQYVQNPRNRFGDHILRRRGDHCGGQREVSFSFSLFYLVFFLILFFFVFFPFFFSSFLLLSLSLSLSLSSLSLFSLSLSLSLSHTQRKKNGSEERRRKRKEKKRKK